MGKSKIPETGAGYLGETMVHKIGFQNYEPRI